MSSQLSSEFLRSFFGQWISRFETSLRTLDALHLAVASKNSIRLITADQALAANAGILGVDVLLLD